MDVGRGCVDGGIGETLVDLALEVGFIMGRGGESFSGDSREAVELIQRRALEFEERSGLDDYLCGVQEAARAVYWELRLEGMVGRN